ncbi:hypothetical protein JCGZ_07821 [Jatropha curcas]|uniref:Transmembrane protein n=1 Tax=Jatropha curcas TaxID=180498 RepID=A0A067KPQ7_JATCU|nr:uncharacterized protein LOC105638306 [Jatropha curcas]KDP34250.1 hypothetical protein JCGZ_07821 [Jatropha curcas]
MSERVSSSFDQINSCCLKTLIDSLKIIQRNKHIYFSIFAFLSLPLSLLHFSLTLSSYPIKSQILHLEYLATRTPTRFEARQVWRESREVAINLLHLKLLYFLPCYLFSLIAAITVVVSTESVYNKGPTSIKLAFAAIKPIWTRPVVTSICIYAIQILYSAVPYTLAAVIGSSSSRLRFVIWVIGLGAELYIIAVSEIGLVVSIVERRFGWDAIRVGSDLMEGRRIFGWVLCGLMAVLTGGIGRRMEGLMVLESEYLAEEPKWTVKEGWEKAAAVLVVLYGVVVVWGFVVTTVFYCECRQRHVVREEEQQLESIDC